MHELLADALDRGAGPDRRDPVGGARRSRAVARPRWPMIVLRTPKGWTGPKNVDGLPAEGTLPLPSGAAGQRPGRTPSTWRCSSSGCAPTGPRSCSTRRARCAPSWQRCRRRRTSRMSANPHANGGLLLSDAGAARLPRLRRRRFRRPATPLSRGDPGARHDAARRRSGRTPRSLPGHGTRRDRLQPPVGVCSRSPTGSGRPRHSTRDDHLAPDGRVMEVLSEHLCQGWLEGYLLTGRHGLFNCYEAFIHIIDSMFNQHAKWLKVTRQHPVAPADRVAQLPALVARLAPGPQRLLPPGPGLHRPRRQQEGRDRPRVPAAGRQLPAVGRRPLPAQHVTTST